MKAIKQWDVKDCGVTCLSYVIQFYGGFVPMNRLREDTYTTKNGTNAYYLLEALRKYGFDVLAKKITWNDLDSIPLPAIGHFTMEQGLDHFMVITKKKKKEVWVMDPARGQRKITKEAFSKIWNNVVLLAIPKQEILTLPKEKSVISMLWDLLKKKKRLLSLLIITSILISFGTIFYSFYLKVGLTRLSLGTWDQYLWFIVCFFGLLLLLKNIFFYLKEALQLYLSREVETDYLYSLLTHIFKLPIRTFKSYREGEILTRIEEAEHLKDICIDSFIQFFLNFFLGFLASIFLFFLNKYLFYLLVIGLLLYLSMGFIFSKMIYRLLLQNMEVEVIWKENIIEHIRAFTPMKHLNRTKERLSKMEENLSARIYNSSCFQKKLLILEYIKRFGLEVLGFILLSYGMYLVFKGNLTLVDFITFQSLYGYLISPTEELLATFPRIFYVKGILSKISEYMALQEEDLANSPETIVDSSITFQGVSFSYIPEMSSLKNISIHVASRTHIFLKGPSGSGKSTLCRLLLKELPNYEGNILIGEQNLKDYLLSTIRENIVYLSQKESVIRGTIRENICFSKEVSDNLFFTVSQICHLEEIVCKRPLRYESFIDETTLSGGEKQRIVLARTLLKTGEIYLLDEVLSEVESSLEQKIITSLRTYLKDKTLIYISHRDQSKLFERTVKIHANI